MRAGLCSPATRLSASRQHRQAAGVGPGASHTRVSAKPPRKKAERLPSEIAFIIVGLVGLIAIVWSGIRSASVQDATKNTLDRIWAKVEGKKGTEDTEVYFQCEWMPMPNAMPTSGELWVYEPHSANATDTLKTIGGASLGKTFGPPGSEMKWFNDPKKIPAGQKCHVFNYGSAPIFDVILTFDVAIREAVKHDGNNGSNSGDILATGKWILGIPKIDEGRADSFVFYFFNRMWPYFIQIDPTPAASFIKSNGEPRQPVKVISSAHNQPIWLNPEAMAQ